MASGEDVRHQQIAKKYCNKKIGSLTMGKLGPCAVQFIRKVVRKASGMASGDERGRESECFVGREWAAEEEGQPRREMAQFRFAHVPIGQLARRDTLTTLGPSQQQHKSRQFRVYVTSWNVQQKQQKRRGNLSVFLWPFCSFFHAQRLPRSSSHRLSARLSPGSHQAIIRPSRVHPHSLALKHVSYRTKET